MRGESWREIEARLTLLFLQIESARMMTEENEAYRAENKSHHSAQTKALLREAKF